MSVDPVKVAALWRMRRAQRYRGSDRREIIARTVQPVDTWSALAMAAGVLFAPLVGLFLLGQLGLAGPDWATGAGDAALIGYGAAALLLAFRWRLVGYAACVPAASAAVVVGLEMVPVASYPHSTDPWTAAMRTVAFAAMIVLSLRALREPEVRADVRPVAWLIGAPSAVAVVSGALALSPMRSVLANPRADAVVGLVEAGVALACAVMMLAAAISRGRLLLAATATMVLAVGLAVSVVSLDPAGVWASLPSAALMVGAVALISTVVPGLQLAVRAVVLHDVRGSRRWETAESELLELRLSTQGRRHDVGNMLAAIDGTLLVLTTKRDELPAGEVDRLVAAVREEVHLLRQVVADDHDHRSYSISSLLSSVVSVHMAARRGIRARIQHGIMVKGRPDRLALVIDNLLTNAALYAPSAQVTVRLRQIDGPEGFAEVTVADDGPGLSDEDLSNACDRGWRGEAAERLPGSGIGLARCRELVDAEGGRMILEPTHPANRDERRGLTVRMTIPCGRSAVGPHRMVLDG